ncbi:protein SRC2-like [Rhodamnia argentea]|uniref:Protein SRC2-like n=1 Tax=Rhodamnia argentea TaxID=178133 RepID=A0A8B8NAF6_9MYRT|nr:protein SRC2-like [Rhodamnia argentea]
MESRPLSITLISAKNLKACNVHLAASLSGDESDDKQRTPDHKKGSTANTWLGHTFKFTVEEAPLLDTRIEFNIEKKEAFLNRFFCFKRGSFFGRKTSYVVGKVDVPIEDLRPDGSAGDTNPKVLSCEVWSSSPKKTKGKTVAVLEFSYKFGERFPVEAPPELEEETVTATPAAERPRTGNATPAYSFGPPAGYGPAAPPPLRRPGWSFLERMGIAVTVNAITSAFNNLVFDGGDFTDT